MSAEDRLLPPLNQRQFQTLVNALAGLPGNRRHILAELNDLLTELTATELQRTVANAPVAELEPYLANYVAAMVETAAHTKHVKPPAWTAAIAPLPEPTFGTSFTSLRFHLLVNAPAAFRRRNIFIDSSIGDRV